MAEDLAKEIAEVKKELSVCQSEMGPIRRKFLEATVEYLKSWCMEEAGALARRKPDNTKSLGKERLSQLKEELRSFQSQLSQVVDATVDVVDNWQVSSSKHTRVFPSFSSDRADFRLPYRLARAVRLAAGHLAPILIRYGYLSDVEWLDHDGGGRVHSNAEFIVPDWTLRCSEPMKEACMSYDRLAAKYYSLSQKIEDLERQKAESEAGNMWDKA